MKDIHGIKVDFDTFPIEENRLKQRQRLADLITFREYMDNYKKLLGREINQQAEWKPMND